MTAPGWLLRITAAAAALVIAAAIGWQLGQPAPVVETAAPEQRQPDGSVVLERRPDASAKPNQETPPGAKVERVGRVTVQPPAPARKPGRESKPCQEIAYPCPSVTVDWSLVREADGGRRFLASSPDGTIVGGVDIPVDTAAQPPAPKRWAAGLSWSPINDTPGAWLERDVPLFGTAARFGVDVEQTRTQTTTGADIRLRVGLAF